jgi:succinylglutamic semialdehyde dehydrogenase
VNPTCHYIAGEWREGVGDVFSSENPINDMTLWIGREATQGEVDEAVHAARESYPHWSTLSFETRARYLHQFEQKLNQINLAETISQETGKPLWESMQEVNGVIQKIGISIKAYKERCAETAFSLGTSTLKVRHKPQGVAAVFGPFNLPAHLPFGHIIPALLAGNTIVFKGSELVPSVSQKLATCWEELPKGVFNLVQGGTQTGVYTASHPQVDALFFTGSLSTGLQLMEVLKAHPEKILALEMGGNNPLVVSDVSDLESAAYLTIQSAFLTAGQRCTCARRLIVPEGKEGDEFLKVLTHMTASVQVGPFTQSPEPFMGPVISTKSAEKLLTAQALLGSQGGVCLVEMRPVNHNRTRLLTPGIMDVTSVKHRGDEELFGPFLQLIRVPSFEEAIDEANQTAYGLVASLLTRTPPKFDHFYQHIRAGLIHWNCPTTGGSSLAPFGGVGKSGNHHPSGYYAVDYCSYPVASMQNEEIYLPKEHFPGITFLART